MLSNLKTYLEGDFMIGNLMRPQKSLNQEKSKFKIQFNKNTTRIIPIDMNH